VPHSTRVINRTIGFAPVDLPVAGPGLDCAGRFALTP